MPLSEADYDSIYEAAEALLCMRQFDAAVKLYDAVVKARPNLAGAWHGLAICLERLGRSEESKAAYERALTLHVKDGGARALLWGGWAALKLGKVEEAYRLMKLSVEMDPSYPYSWHSLAVAARRAGRRQESEEAMNRYKSMTAEKPYDRRECEGIRMLREALSTAGDDAVKLIAAVIDGLGELKCS
ncbi:hypothetical protein GCM10007981_07040 [Thermocladium modestius]|uniref:Tetratricopeptide repeat protein n=1 Tax=Thermocladium modestius TaxID=62609 RepID=A0A830GUG0_9CREN|nr:tetratricopeptide repeat protein [Thermocladium modestius]GGP20146.1 hypothetical protein GCM10007981_07040 [Thermocladium modestius]